MATVSEWHAPTLATGMSQGNCTGLPLAQLLLANCSSVLPEEWRNLEVVYHDQVWGDAVLQRIAMLAVVMVATLSGNLVILILLTCSRHKRRNSRVNVFIINLAVGDLSVLVFTMTTEVLFVVFEGAWVLGAAACKILLYGQMITLASTTFILTAMSFDRYMAICRPLSFANSRARARKMIAVSWILATIFACPQLLIFRQVATGIYLDGTIKYKCLSRGYTAWWQRKLYFTFMTSYILIIPALLISFCYINVVKVVWSQGQESKETDGVSLRKSVGDKKAIPRAKIKTVKMTLSIICTFIMCWTPYFVVHLIHIWNNYEYDIPDFVYALVETMALWNSALNPILYGCFNIRMKSSCRDLLCSCFKGGQITPSSRRRVSRGSQRTSSPRTYASTASTTESNCYAQVERTKFPKDTGKDGIKNGFRLRARFTGEEGPCAQTCNLLEPDKCEHHHVEESHV